jgi:3D (Asp-Asp-Asp) domain-containing protein
MAGAHGNFVLDKGYRAGAVLTKYRAVKFLPGQTETSVVPVAAITDVIAGVVQFGVSATELPRGKGASCRTMGETIMEAAAAIPLGSIVAINASGQAVVATTGARVIGTCTGAPALNPLDQITVRLEPYAGLAP